MTITDYKNGKLIILSKAFGSKTKILYTIYFIPFFVVGVGVPIKLYPDDPTLLKTIVLLLISIFFLFIAYKCANKAALSERIYVNKEELQFIKQGLFSAEKKSFTISRIRNFRYLDRSEPSRHPLAGQSVDYLGFQSSQKLIHELHGDKRMAFDYDGRAIPFGENIYSWEFDELVVLFFEITGNDLRENNEPKEQFYSEETNA